MIDIKYINKLETYTLGRAKEKYVNEEIKEKKNKEHTLLTLQEEFTSYYDEIKEMAQEIFKNLYCIFYHNYKVNDEIIQIIVANEKILEDSEEFKAFTERIQDLLKAKNQETAQIPENMKDTSDLADEIDNLMNGWKRLVNRNPFKKAVKGWFRALEVTHNLDVNSVSYDKYHPHFHVVLAVNRNYFTKNYIKHEDWCKMWQECMKLDYLPNVDVRRFKASNKKELQKSVSEAAKYTVKDNDFLIPDNPSLQDDTVAILTSALFNRRLIAFGGVFKEVHKQLKLDDIETGDLVNVEGEDLREDVEYYRKVVMWNFGYSNYYINSIILSEDVKRQDLEEQMSRIKPKAKKSYDDLENFKKNMSNKKLTYSVEDIQKKIDEIDRKVGTGAKEEQI